MDAICLDLSPKAARISKPQDSHPRHQLQRPSKEEKRADQIYFMRRRGQKTSEIQDLIITLPEYSKDTNTKPEKKLKTRPSQPRQKRESKKEYINLANLSNIVLEMKEIVNNIPDIQEIVNKTNIIQKKILTFTPKNRSREISLNKSAQKPKKLKNYILSSKGNRIFMPNKPSSNNKTRRLPVIKHKPNEDLAVIQNYFLDFHAKSKFLLKNLEKSVLGENKLLL